MLSATTGTTSEQPQALTSPLAPLVYAGRDMTVELTQAAVLSSEVIGNGSDDLAIQWSVVAGPGEASIANSDAANTFIEFTAPGVYEIQLAVSNDYTIVTDTLMVTVLPEHEISELALLYLSDELTFSGISDHVVLAHDDSFLVDEGSVSFWFRSDDVESVQGLFSKDSQSFDTGGHLSFNIEDGSLHAHLQSTVGTVSLTSGKRLTAGAWHHATLNFGPGGMELFLDGELRDSDAYSGGLGASSGGVGNHEPIVLGAVSWQSGDLQATPVGLPLLSGAMDDVILTDRRLSEAEINELVTGVAATPTPTPPVAFDGAAQVIAGQTVSGVAVATDANGAPLTYSLVDAPDYGAFAFNPDGSYAYAADAEYVGTDSFTFQAHNGAALSNLATVSITVEAAPTHPTGPLTTGRLLHVDDELNFNGISDHVVLPHDDAYLVDEGSVSFWFRSDNVEALQGLFSKDSTGYDTGGHLSFNIQDSSLHAHLQSTSDTVSLTSGKRLTAGAWHHATLNFGPGGMELFLDGELRDSDAYSGGLSASSGGVGNHEPIVLGAVSWLSGNLQATPVGLPLLSGAMDEVVLADHRLSEAEISELVTGIAATPTPTPPVALDGSATVSEGQTISGVAVATDANGEPLTYSLASAPDHGAFAFNPDGSYAYAADAGFTGTDSFTFQAHNGALDSNIATISITVEAAGARPTGPQAEGRLLLASDELTFSGISDHVVLAHDDAYLVDEGSVSFWFRSDDVDAVQGLFSKDSQGYDTGGHLSFNIEDGSLHAHLQSTTDTVSLTSGKRLTAGAWHHATLNFGPGGTELFLDGELRDSDAYAGGLGASSGGVGNHEPIVLGAVSWQSGDLRATPVGLPLLSGAMDEVILADHRLSALEISELMTGLAATPTPPVAMDSSARMIAGQTFSGVAEATDANGDPLTFSLVGDAAHGLLVFNSDGSFAYTPEASFLGVDSFTFVATDGAFTSEAGSIALVVEEFSLPETIVTNSTLAVVEGEAASITTAVLETVDADNDASDIIYSLTSVPTNGAVLLSGAPTSTFSQADVASGLVSFQHDGSEDDGGSFTFSVNDLQGGGTNGVFYVAVTPVDDEESLSINQSLAVFEGGAGLIRSSLLLSTDSDTPASQLTYTISSGPANGTVLLSGAATTSFTQADVDANLVSYQHDGSAGTTDSFAFNVDDGQGTSTSGVFTISVIFETIPEFAAWQENMLAWGQHHGDALGDYLANEDASGALAATFYDAIRVFEQIAAYTGDSSWYDYVDDAVAAYRDNYVIANDGLVAGYWNFTRGLVLHYERTGDVASRDAVVLLSENAAYARDSTPVESTVDHTRSRSTAYSILSYIDAERVGEARRDRLDVLFEHALGHLDQWFIDESDPEYAPFMFSLTADALIEYYKHVDQDPRILEKIEMGANWTWDNAWVAEDESFWYRLHQAQDGGHPTLNLLIAPIYEWLYQETGNLQYRSQADQIFAGGVQGAFINVSKQFNQNYQKSFDFLTMRLSPLPQQSSAASESEALPSSDPSPQASDDAARLAQSIESSEARDAAFDEMAVGLNKYLDRLARDFGDL